MNSQEKINRLYISLLKKYGESQGFWKMWCNSKKSRKNKEEIALGAILTQRTNWQNVEKAFDNLRKKDSLSIEKIYKISDNNIKSLEKLVRPSGFYKQKAKRLFLFCKFIIENHGSLNNFFKQDLKTCRSQLLEIPGIGQETADSILLYAGDKLVFVIDEYTRRFVKKYKLAENLSYDFLQKLFENNLKKDYCLYQNFHALIVIDGKNN